MEFDLQNDTDYAVNDEATFRGRTYRCIVFVPRATRQYPDQDPAHWQEISAFDRGYQHVQTEPAAEWMITHNLGRYPAVTIITAAGDEISGGVHHVSVNQLQVTFDEALSGRVNLS